MFVFLFVQTVYIVEAKKGCKKKSLNILSLAADLLKRNNIKTVRKKFDITVNFTFTINILSTNY